MSDQANPAGLATRVSDAREWAQGTYPGAVLRRFFDLELLDKSFGLAAQVFVALLPLVIVIVTFVVQSDPEYIGEALSSRFGLSGAADAAIRALFRTSGGAATISWMAILVSVFSAFSLARRLSRVYASIFGLPPLLRAQLWRGLAWIGLQCVLYAIASQLRQIGREGGFFMAGLVVVGLVVLWIACDAGGIKLLVPSVSRRVLLPSAVLSSVGRIAIAIWAGVYMPAVLSRQAEQFGPIGVTFSLFTYFLVAVVVLLVAPLLVAVWFERRDGVRAVPVPAE